MCVCQCLCLCTPVGLQTSFLSSLSLQVPLPKVSPSMHVECPHKRGLLLCRVAATYGLLDGVGIMEFSDVTRLPSNKQRWEAARVPLLR